MTQACGIDFASIARATSCGRRNGQDRAVERRCQRIRSRIESVLRMAGLTADSISAVFVTGGAAMMPSVLGSVSCFLWR